MFDISKTQSQDVSMEANAHTLFASASASVSQGDQSSEHKRSNFGKSETRMEYIGSPPDPVTGIMARSQSPGLVHKEIEPVCALIENNVVRNGCYDFYRSTGFCFSGLPDVSFSHDNYENMLAHLYQMKSFGHCAAAGTSMLGFELNTSHQFLQPPLQGWEMRKYFKDKSKYDKNQAGCMVSCASNSRCAVASVHNGKCTHCLAQTLPSHTELLFKTLNTTSLWNSKLCEKVYSDGRIGAKAKWTTSSSFPGWMLCMVTFPDELKATHCYQSLEPTDPSDYAFSHSFIPNKIPWLPQKGSFSANLGVPLFLHDRVFGEALDDQFFVMEIEYGRAVELFEYAASFFSEAAYASNKNPAIVDNITLSLARNCLSYCQQNPGCDSMAVRIDPPMRTFYDFLVFQRMGNVLKTFSAEAEANILKFTGDDYVNVFKDFDLSHIYKNETYHQIHLSNWEVGQFINYTRQDYRDLGYTESEIADLFVHIFKPKFERSILVFNEEHKLVKDDHQNEKKSAVETIGRGLVGTVGALKNIFGLWHHPPSGPGLSGNKRDHSEEELGKSDLDMKATEVMKALGEKAFEVPLRPWYPNFAPLKLPGSCQFFNGKESVLLTGNLQDCKTHTFNIDCKMKVGQFIDIKAFDVYGVDSFQEHWVKA